MNAADLQDRLAHLIPGETLQLSVVDVEQAFPYEWTSDGRRTAVINLATWYWCRLVFFGPDESQTLIIRHGEPESSYFRDGIRSENKPR